MQKKILTLVLPECGGSGSRDGKTKAQKLHKPNPPNCRDISCPLRYIMASAIR